MLFELTPLHRFCQRKSIFMVSDCPEFKFRGSRDYLHSSTMFDYLVPQDPAPAGIDFAVHKMTECQCEVVDVEDESRRDHLIATYRSDGMERFFYELPDKPLSDRYACNELDICAAAKREDQAMVFTVPPIEGASFIESAVGVYKHLVQAITPGLNGKLVYATMSLRRIPANGECQVAHRRAIKGGFYQATLSHNGEALGKLVFGLV